MTEGQAKSPSLLRARTYFKIKHVTGCIKSSVPTTTLNKISLGSSWSLHKGEFHPWCANTSVFAPRPVLPRGVRHLRSAAAIPFPTTRTEEGRGLPKITAGSPSTLYKSTDLRLSKAGLKSLLASPLSLTTCYISKAPGIGQSHPNVLVAPSYHTYLVGDIVPPSSWTR